MPIKYDFLFQNCGIKLPKGLLLYGYPGCGKTYFAQAIAIAPDNFSIDFFHFRFFKSNKRPSQEGGRATSAQRRPGPPLHTLPQAPKKNLAGPSATLGE